MRLRTVNLPCGVTWSNPTSFRLAVEGGSCTRVDDAPNKQDGSGLDVANQKDKGAIDCDLNGGGAGAVVGMITAVAAAASVPASSTDTNVLCMTSPKWHLLFFHHRTNRFV